ncbi:hypothetical protein Tco_0368442 [Tanacetum coccineum]
MSKKMAELEDDFREFKAHTERRFVSLDMSIRAYRLEEDQRHEEEDQRHEERIRSKGSHSGLRHCATKRKKRKGPFVWTKSKSRVVIEVGQTEAIDGGLNCDSRLAIFDSHANTL